MLNILNKKWLVRATVSTGTTVY